MTGTAVAILERGAAKTRYCGLCDAKQWVGDMPCARCLPYGPRIAAASRHPDNTPVLAVHTQRMGVVLRSWRRHQGIKRPDVFVFCDVRYDDGTHGVAWEADLVAVTGQGGGEGR